MKWTIDLGNLPDYVRVETGGNPSTADFVSMWDEILGGVYWHPGFTVLMDNRRLEVLVNSDAFTRAAVDYFAKNNDRLGNACIAVLTINPETFKYARQFQYGIRFKGSDVVLQLFKSEMQARDWLRHFCKLNNTRSSEAST